MAFAQAGLLPVHSAATSYSSTNLVTSHGYAAPLAVAHAAPVLTHSAPVLTHAAPALVQSYAAAPVVAHGYAAAPVVAKDYYVSIGWTNIFKIKPSRINIWPSFKRLFAEMQRFLLLCLL